MTEAFQFDGDFMNSRGEYYVPEWAIKAFKKGIFYFEEYRGVPGQLFIKCDNMGSRYVVEVGDYIIKYPDGKIGVRGERQFLNTYKKVGQWEWQ